MIKRICLFYAALLLPVIAGCAAGSGNLAARVDQHDQQINKLLSQVGQVEQVLPGQAEMWSQMQAMRQELNTINGKLDDLSGGGETANLRTRVQKLENTLKEFTSQMSSTPEQGSYTPQSVSSSHSGVSPTQVSGTPVPAGASSAQAGSTARYDAGIKSFDAKRYTDAVVAFKEFAEANPRHNLASNAFFWQGESYFQMKDYARAALAYQQVIGNYPGSAKIQSSLLKQGMALYYAGKKPAGRERLEDLVKRYPSSQDASRAKQFLAQNP
ncbi:tol-pal system protein YbgF [Desulfovibrio sp. OttesenSCG-928-G15]|nr:tol-pal system protein YbgF [Desulfovibrio sp. OttesenSCG-928-G15]